MYASSAQFTFEFLDVEYKASVLEFSTTENISHVSSANMVLTSKQFIPCDEVVNQEGTLTISNLCGIVSTDRYFNGIIRSFRHSGMNGPYHIYEAYLVPSLWLLSLRQNCRIFQDMKLQDIIGKLLQENNITSDLV